MVAPKAELKGSTWDVLMVLMKAENMAEQSVDMMVI
jgi:hypothetical protein